MSMRIPSIGYHFHSKRTSRSAETAQITQDSTQRGIGIRYSRHSAHKHDNSSCIVQTGTAAAVCRTQKPCRTDSMADAQRAGTAQERSVHSGRKSPHARDGTDAGKKMAFQPSIQPSSRPGDTDTDTQSKNKGSDSADKSVQSEVTAARQTWNRCNFIQQNLPCGNSLIPSTEIYSKVWIFRAKYDIMSKKI